MVIKIILYITGKFNESPKSREGKAEKAEKPERDGSFCR